jgi:hypothetical protein
MCGCSEKSLYYVISDLTNLDPGFGLESFGKLFETPSSLSKAKKYEGI